jgi:hypothetical protein
MRIELKNESPLYTEAVEEADDILTRIDLHQGEFEYFSTVKPGHMFKLEIRPMKNGLVHGQPRAWQHSDLFHLTEIGGGEKTHIARYYYQ